MTTSQPSYVDGLKHEFGELIAHLDLTAMQKRFLLSRWLDQIAWLEGKAGSAQRHYYRLRLTTVVGAVFVPALVSLTTLDGNAGVAARVAAWVISLIVAVSAAVEQFFHFGDRWRSYRRTVERLKMEGWLYFQLSGAYSAGHKETFTEFARRVEEILSSDVDAYLTQIAAEKGSSPEQPSNP